MRLLLDTCTISDLRNPRNSAVVQGALASFEDEAIFVSVLTVGEITKGIAGLAKSRKKQELSVWLQGLEQHFSSRILPIDRETAVLWGELTARAKEQGVTVPVSDGLIAATALRHNLHVMTRNARDFEATGAFVIDPWRTE